MTRMTSGQFFAEAMKGYGVSHVFFLPSIFHQAMVALEDTGIRRIATHHEIAAAYMADGYARASHRPGVVLTQQVGASNLAAGLREAYLASSPVVALSGGGHPDSRYRYLYQVLEDFPMFEPVTKFNARVEKPSRLPDLLRQAFRVATTGSPGPVHLELPGRLGEVVAGEVDVEMVAEEQFSQAPAYRPEPEAARVQEVARLLAQAKRPVIVAGGGVVASEASAELVALAEKLRIPVALSLSGKEVMPEDHPLCLGLPGSYGRACANQALEEADLVFFVGSRAGGMTTNNWQSPKVGVAAIQLDIDPAEIGRNYPVKAGLLGDAKVTLRRLLAVAEPSGATEEWIARACAALASWREEVTAGLDLDATPIRPERLCRELTEVLPADAVVVADTGHAAIWSGTMVGLRHPGQRYLRCAGTLGWAFPASLGAKCALPDRPVVCFTGDGGLYTHLPELETAARYGINTVVVVNDNAALQQVSKGLSKAYGGTQRGRAKEMWTFRRETDLAAVARDLGCVGIRVERPRDIRGALDLALSAGRPAVVDVVTDVDATPAWA